MHYCYQKFGSLESDEEETLLVKFIPEENGRVYLYEKAYSDIPGLVPLGAASYAMERLEPNGEASEEALAAWEARGEKLYLITNEKYTSQVYLSGPFTAVSTLAEAPGYAALDRIEMCIRDRTRRQLAISWGVHPYLTGEVDSTDRLFSMAGDVARREGAVACGDTVVITAGVPIGISGTTNLIKAQVVGERA